MRFRCIGGRARAQKQQRPTSIMRGPLGALYSCAVLFAGVTSPEKLMDDKDLDSRTEMSHSRSRRRFLYAVGGAGIVSAAGLASMGAQRSATKIDHRRSQMESPIELVRRFCAAWSDNIGAAELAAFFTDDAVYHNIPLAPVTGREAIANNIASFIRPGAPGIEGIQFRVINIAANGPVVMTERVDVFKLPDKSFELPVMGTFEVSDGKISAWRDYFDMNQFTTRMG
jgi:limonene-1,2-epoxide hydrolase